MLNVNMSRSRLSALLCCVAACLAACGRSTPKPPGLPTPAAVQAAIASSPLNSPYKTYSVRRVEAQDNAMFVVLFQPTDYVGAGTPIPFPLYGEITDSGYIVYCLEQDANGVIQPEGKAVRIPFGTLRRGGITGAR